MVLEARKIEILENLCWQLITTQFLRTGVKAHTDELILGDNEYKVFCDTFIKVTREEFDEVITPFFRRFFRSVKLQEDTLAESKIKRTEGCVKIGPGVWRREIIETVENGLDTPPYGWTRKKDDPAW